MKYIADKTLLVASEVSNKHLKEVDVKTKKSIEGYFNKCTEYIGWVLLETDKMLDASMTADEFTMNKWNGHFHVNDINIGITIKDMDKFFFKRKISKHNLRRIAILIDQLHIYTSHIYVNPAQTLMKLADDRGTILVALKN